MKTFRVLFIFISLLLQVPVQAESCRTIPQPAVENVFYLNKLSFMFSPMLPVCRNNNNPEFLLKVNEKWGKDPCPFFIFEGNRLVVAHSENQRRMIKLNDHYTMYTDGNAEVVIQKDKIQVINGKVEIYNSSGNKLPIVNIGRIKECEGSFMAEPHILGHRG